MFILSAAPFEFQGKETGIAPDIQHCLPRQIFRYERLDHLPAVSRVFGQLRASVDLLGQALEADALHFSTDIWSSSIVIVGLLIVYLTTLFHLPAWLNLADS